MARLRSPSYPNINIEQAIDIIGKMYGENRTFPMDREVAAKAMGHSGLTGPASKKVASLIQYGLLEKYAKNEVRVSKMAESILHPDDETEKGDLLTISAYKPRLFNELRERFPGGVPSENNLTSYLLKRGFSDVAVPRAVQAYLKTCSFLEKNRAYESHDLEHPDVSKSSINQSVEGDLDMEGANVSRTIPSMGRSRQINTPNLNAINVSVSGGIVQTNVMLLDSMGLEKLKRKIDALQTLIEDEDTGLANNDEESQMK